MLRPGLVILALVAVLAGCKEKQPAARKVTPPTTEEAEAIGKEFAKHLAPCDAGELDRMIDMELILARAVAGRAMRQSDVKGISRGFGGIGARFCMELTDPELTARYLRTQVIDGSPQPLIRIVFGVGVNYYQLELDKRNNAIRVADIYLYLAGEKMSETLGSALEMLMETPSSSAVTKVSEMKQHMRDQEWQQARDVLQSLPATMRKRKPIMLTEVLIASELGDDAYVAAMDAYTKSFPDDPSVTLIQIDRFLLRKQYDQALATVEKLDKQLGGDPYLELLRVDAYVGMGKHAEAVTAGKRGVAAEPTLEHLWWALLSAQAAAGQFKEALPTLDTLKEKFGTELSADALAADERFVKLSESAELKAWEAKQAGLPEPEAKPTKKK